MDTHKRKGGIYTFTVPKLETLFAASLEKGPGRWTHQRHHLGKVLFVVEQAVFYSAKETTSLKQIPNLQVDLVLYLPIPR